MKTLFIAVAILFAATSLSALTTEYKAMPSADEGYSNFQDTTKKDKKKKDTTKKDTSLVQYHR